MEESTIYYISEAAKKVQVEAHVLRYWEDELKLKIKRNEMGHRCYSGRDIEQLRQIKLLKEQGLQLKAIRTVLGKEGGILSGQETPAREQTAGLEKTEAQDIREEIREMKELQGEEADEGTMEQKVEEMVMKKAQKYMVTLSRGKDPVIEAQQENLEEYASREDMDKSQKAARLQYLLQHMITEAVKSANQDMCTEIKESIIKELDYQFRQQEERDEEHWKKEEEHYRKIDEMIRQRHLPKEKLGKGKKMGTDFIGSHRIINPEK